MSQKPIRCVLLAAFVLIGANCGAGSEPPSSRQTAYSSESTEAKDRRMAWWREARFGMFIHWGIYSVPAGEYQGQRSDRIGEWIQSWANIPRQEYEKFAARFNPVRFDASAWAQLAQDAGMKYLIITSKHHDGFAIFDSRVSDYDIVDATPYGKDVLEELSRECRSRGIRFGVYYSIMDWHHPSQFVDAEGKHPTAGNGMNRIRPEAKPDYIRYMKAQLEELVSGYDVAVLWFDGEWVDWWTEEDGKDLYAYVRSLKPEIIINNRVGKGRQGMQGLNKGPGYAGDFGTPEQEIPPTGLPGVDWESCMTMNDTWGFKSYDDNWKSSETLIRNLVDIASKGGNYLLNVGPTSEGLIPQPSVERLTQMGDWLRVNGESIYGTAASPFQELPWGRATRHGNRVFLHVFDWPSGLLEVPALEGRVEQARLLGRPQEPLAVEAEAGRLLIRLPAAPPDATASVVELRLHP